MKLWPSYSFEIDTNMSREEIIDILKPRVESQKFFGPSSSISLFYGTVTVNGFEFSRIINYRNSFLPVIHGLYSSGKFGEIISIKMKLHPITMAFLCCWLGFAGLIQVILLMQWASNPGDWDISLMAPLGMIVFAVAITLGGFWFEVIKQKPLLMELFRLKRQ